MGTGGFIGFIIDGKLKGTYNHHDSQPEELGSDIITFIREIIKNNKLNELKNKLSKIETVEKLSTPTPEQISLYSKFSDRNMRNGKLTDWYVLLRITQGVETFKCIMVGNLHHIIDNIDFFQNKDLCIYAYILNFDSKCVDFYNLGKLIGRITFETLTYDKRYSNDKWIEIIYKR